MASKRIPIHPVLPSTRPGTWAYDGRHRYKAKRCLEKLERVVPGVEAAIKRLRQSKGYGGPRPKISRDDWDDMWLFAEMALLYACLAVEQFVNYYGVVRFGEPIYKTHYERLPPGRKLSAVVERCTGETIAADAEILTVLGRLYRRRNFLAHPKAYDGETFDLSQYEPAVRVARESVADMQRFFELLAQYDPEVRGHDHL